MLGRRRNRSEYAAIHFQRFAAGVRIIRGLLSPSRNPAANQGIQRQRSRRENQCELRAKRHSITFQLIAVSFRSNLASVLSKARPAYDTDRTLSVQAGLPNACAKICG